MWEFLRDSFSRHEVALRLPLLPIFLDKCFDIDLSLLVVFFCVPADFVNEIEEKVEGVKTVPVT